MALYRNGTRFAAIVTIRVTAAPNPEKALKIGVGAAMKNVTADVGSHDVPVGPGESLELEQGVVAEFLASRSER